MKYTVIVLKPPVWLETKPELFPTSQSLQYVAIVRGDPTLQSAGLQGRWEAFMSDCSDKSVNSDGDLSGMKEEDYAVLGVITENGRYLQWFNGSRP